MMNRSHFRTLSENDHTIKIVGHVLQSALRSISLNASLNLPALKQNSIKDISCNNDYEL
jgi:hypothetical protein